MGLELKYPPVAVFCAALLGVGVLTFLLPDLDLGDGDPWVSAVASLLGVAGAVAGAAGVVQFRLKRTTVHPQHPERTSALVADGIYAWSRNPMYLGLALILAAVTVYTLNLGGALMTAAFVAYINRFQIAPEERFMREKFGRDFDAYCNRVRRWI